MAGWSTASRYTSTRFFRSAAFVDATGYIVLSGNVSAFRNVCMDVFSRFTNGSFTGKRSLPHRTECSRMWNTPVLLAGAVLNAMEKDFSLSSTAIHMARAPVAS